ncbi:hypothetical protein IE4872_PC00151 (plasmid) [Rhizobium gallicum]|uniref:Uncharacterized protein n=4 Tax=Rhizobium TaxID=379 RepID=A0A0B4X977_9HYPH|nr:hypothetical protein RGR602_PB00158 [Rhizobium gallicum bv. gallicum R602sp]APO70182.1 hypothetical protein IE4872_PC00151 [Rhizobium gallicum]MBB4276523.1 hypothetical protein [Rhizobium mongolense]TCU33033.1 hypothetical protein EV129_11730 [Rhizobium azibense]TDW34179.1 hypothetical protein EV128_104186 [Rhizobium azibense]
MDHLWQVAADRVFSAAVISTSQNKRRNLETGNEAVETVREEAVKRCESDAVLPPGSVKAWPKSPGHERGSHRSVYQDWS